jgi:hypothetical protein
MLSVMDRSPFEPLMLFRSFATVVSGFVTCLMVYFGVALFLGYFFFPQFMDFLNLDTAAQRQMVEENIQAARPLAMFLSHLVLSLILFWFLGWLAAAVAPFAHFQHGLFIAILIFAWCLQTFVESPPSKKLMDLAEMILLPIPILYGARTASAAFVDEPQS